MTVPRIFATQTAGNVPASYLDVDFVAVQDPVATGSTTARTLQDRFAEVFNVKDYGAKGNGSTDDSAAIQATVDAAESFIASDPTLGAVVYLPSAIYVTSTTITVNTDGIVIRGDGNEATVWINDTANTDTLLFSKGAAPWLQQIELHSIRFYSNLVDPGTSGAQVRLQNCGSFIIEGCWIEQKFDNLVIEGGLGGFVTNSQIQAGANWISRKTGSSAVRLKSVGSQAAQANFTSCNIQSSGANTYLDDALVIESGDGPSFHGCHIGFGGQSQIRIRQNTATDIITGAQFVGCFIDGFFGATPIDGVVIENPNSRTPTLGSIFFDGCLISGTFSGDVVRVASTATNLDILSINGGTIAYGAGSQQVHISARKLMINGTYFENGPAAGIGVLIDGSTALFNITNCSFYNNPTYSMATAVQTAGAADYGLVGRNNYGNIATSTNFTGAGTHISAPDLLQVAFSGFTYSPGPIVNNGNYQIVGKWLFAGASSDGLTTWSDAAFTHGVGIDVTTDGVWSVRNTAHNAAGTVKATLQTATNATTGLAAGVLAATTNASIVLTDGSGQVYRVPCII
jgi:hypothetical protein